MNCQNIVRIGALFALSHIFCVTILVCMDPFQTANQLYEMSEWKAAYQEYNKVHEGIKNRTVTIEDRKDLISGHVNYADVLSALGVGEWSKGNYAKAKELLLQSCDHRRYRMEDGQFGREPLNSDEELDDEYDVAGKKIVVLSERKAGALGDTFYPSALLQYLKEKGAYVILVPQNPLVGLYTLPGSKQAHYVDEVVRHGTQLPEHDKKIYLWSLLSRYLKDTSVEKLFPLKPSLSGGDVTEFTTIIEKRAQELRGEYGVDPLVIGSWYRGAGNAVQAADWRTLSRDPGADKVLKAFKGLPVLIVNLEGMGRRPITENEYALLQAKNELGVFDSIDITEEDTSNVLNLPGNFDRKVAFGDTLSLMDYIINKKRGFLVGCDTSLANAAAAIANKSGKKPVFVVLNKKADHRWSDSTKSPREWHHSDNVTVFQAQEQGDWNAPLKQVREEIEQYIKEISQK